MPTFRYPPTLISESIALLTPTVTGDTVAYSTGDNVGGKLTLAGLARIDGGSGRIQSCVITSKSLQTATFDVVIFNADPSASTFTNNGAQDIADADLTKVVGVIQCTTVVPLSGASIHQGTNLSLPFKLPAGKDGYAAIVVRGTPTLGSNSDLAISLRVIQN